MNSILWNLGCSYIWSISSNEKLPCNIRPASFIKDKIKQNILNSKERGDNFFFKLIFNWAKLLGQINTLVHVLSGLHVWVPSSSIKWLMQLIFTEWLLHVKRGSKHEDKMMKKIHVFMEYFFFSLWGGRQKTLDKCVVCLERRKFCGKIKAGKKDWENSEDVPGSLV